MEEERVGAPYVSFSTFQTAVEVFRGWRPERVDRSCFRSFSNQDTTYLLSAFRFFRLIDDEGIPQAALAELADNVEERPTVLKRLMSEAYGGDLVQRLAKMTPKQLDEHLENAYSYKGSTKDKARRFLLHACAFSSIKLNYAFESGLRARRTRRKSTQPKRTARNGNANPAKVSEEERPAQPATNGTAVGKWDFIKDKFPEFNPEWDTETQNNWFNSFNRLLELQEKNGTD